MSLWRGRSGPEAGRVDPSDVCGGVEITCDPRSLQVGDSIVHKARETLERAIRLVNDTKKWGARVVYGDTDR